MLHEGECTERIFTDGDIAFLNLNENSDTGGEFLNKTEIKELLISKNSNSFAFKVFNWNINQLLSGTGFYDPSFKKLKDV